MKKATGVIYILTNPSFKEYVKIGYGFIFFISLIFSKMVSLIFINNSSE